MPDTPPTGPTRTVAIASDHAGHALKSEILRLFAGRATWIDLGTHTPDSVDYPDYGYTLGRAVAQGRASMGIAICGTGVGMSIAANRFGGVRAALCTDVTMARLARQHNDANVLALGARIIGPSVAVECIEVFMNTPFEGGRHQKRVEKLNATS